MSATEYTRIVLNERPPGDITLSTFRAEKAAHHLQAGRGEVVVQVLLLSLDPAMRGWISDARSYLPPVEIGETMRAHGLATVVKAGEGTTLRPGDIVTAWSGWTEYAVLKEDAVQKIEVLPGAKLIDYLGYFSITGGYTAYVGMIDVGKIKAGDTLVVTGAAGSVGSLACQIGKIYGAKVIGIAGTEDKCKWLKEEIKVDAALNYKSSSFQEDFKNIGYIDLFFDNVGGEILNLALTRLNKGARIVLCGAISQYNTADPKGITNYPNLIWNSAKMEGFVVIHYQHRFPEALRELSKWVAEGRLVRKFTS
ncbi:alcohol dehydrogenase [Russula dissimulans]|nr:alcohol dehydrogenase [Russula dissimulans]